MRDNWAFVVILTLLFVGAIGYLLFIRQSQETGDAGRELEQRLAEATERVGSAEASNRQLRDTLRDAGAITEQLTTITGTSVSNSEEAIRLIKQIIIQVESLDVLLDRYSAGSDSGVGD
jgi:Tfp pilus assembly protein PilO